MFLYFFFCFFSFLLLTVCDTNVQMYCSPNIFLLEKSIERRYLQNFLNWGKENVELKCLSV